MADILELKRRLNERILDVVDRLLPGGHRDGHEYRTGSLSGGKGQSVGVHLTGHKTGLWSEFNGGTLKGDLISLWMAVKGMKLPEALDDIRAYLGVSRPELHRPVKRTYTRPEKPRCVTPRNAVRDYLVENRNIPFEVLERYRVGEAGDNIVFPFLLPDGTLAMAKVRRAEDGAKPKPTAADCEPVLFGWQAIPDDARDVVITEGEIDALSWAAYGHPAMSVPYGGGGGDKQRWIESEYDRMDRFERIYLATDMDKPGDEAAEEIANRLGRHRCLRVRMPRKDANDCLMDGIPAELMARALAEAEHLDPAGLRRASEFADNVVALFWPQEGAHVGYQTPYGKLGYRLLFRPAELTIWTGDSGAGKSQILSDCVIDWIKQGSRICLSSLEMKPAQTLKRMAKQVVGTEKPTEPAIRAAMAWLDQGLLLYELTGKQKADALLDVFAYARAKYGCDQFVIDSLMRLGIASDDYNSQEAVIYRIVEWSIAHGVHTHLVAHARKGDKERSAPGTEDIKGASEIGANAFNIISVWRNRRLEEDIKAAKTQEEKDPLLLKPGVLFNLAKQRNGDYEGKVGLWFDDKSYRYTSDGHGQAWRRSYLPEDWSDAPAEDVA